MATDEHGNIKSLTERVLGAVFEVSNILGAGFLEKGLRTGFTEGAVASELARRPMSDFGWGYLDKSIQFGEPP